MLIGQKLRVTCCVMGLSVSWHFSLLNKANVGRWDLVFFTRHRVELCPLEAAQKDAF